MLGAVAMVEKEKSAARMARVQLSRQIKKEKKERREVILQVVIRPQENLDSVKFTNPPLDFGKLSQ